MAEKGIIICKECGAEARNVTGELVEMGLCPKCVSEKIEAHRKQEGEVEVIRIFARRAIERRIKYAKQQLIRQCTTAIDSLTRTREKLEAGIDDPTSYCGINLFGEVQNVGQLESLVGQIHGLHEAYKEIKG